MAEMPDIPKVFCFSGRTQDAVESILRYVEQHSDSHAMYQLLSELSNISTNMHPYRGYTIMKKNDEKNVRDIQKCSGDKRPIWFVYSGMGTQWAGMGRDLMQIEVFHKTVVRCSEALKPLGLNPYSLIMDGDEETYQNTLNSFVCIATMQVITVCSKFWARSRSLVDDNNWLNNSYVQTELAKRYGNEYMELSITVLLICM